MECSIIEYGALCVGGGGASAGFLLLGLGSAALLLAEKVLILLRRTLIRGAGGLVWSARTDIRRFNQGVGSMAIVGRKGNAQCTEQPH
jgi:hypothetical protein